MKVYLDYQATTPVDPLVLSEMLPYFLDNFGNSASAHFMGDQAKEAVELARKRIARIINADPECIYFTNSATEANNIILKSGISETIITTNSEHISVVKCVEEEDWKEYNRRIRYLEILSDGSLDYKQLGKILKNYSGSFVSIIFANNEIGTIHDLQKIGKLCKKRKAYFHTDATQAIGKVKIDVERDNIFALTMNAHKIYGPKGIGALYIRKAKLVQPLLDGGYQSIISSGTQNIPAIVGFGKACELSIEKNYIEIYNTQVRKLRDKLLENLKSDIPDLIVNGTMENRLPNNLNISIPGLPSEVLMKGLDDVCISGGSACQSGKIEPSHVIKVLGNSIPECAVRFGLGKDTTAEEIDYVSTRVIEVYKAVKNGKR